MEGGRTALGSRTRPHGDIMDGRLIRSWLPAPSQLDRIRRLERSRIAFRSTDAASFVTAQSVQISTAVHARRRPARARAILWPEAVHRPASPEPG